MLIDRREFMQSSAALAAAPYSELIRSQNEAPFIAHETVEMGKAKIKVSRLGFGIGDGRSKDYLKMGQEVFTKLIRHALDQGIRNFDMDPCHVLSMLKTALNGVARESFTMVLGVRNPENRETLPQLIDGYRHELNVDFIDGVLIIAIGKANWAEQFKELRDTLSNELEKGRIKACGVSVHGYEGLNTLSTDPWVDFALISCNHKGIFMDAPSEVEATDRQRRDYSVPVIQAIHRSNVGVTAMKTFAASGFDSAEERMASLRFIKSIQCVDSMPIKFKSTAQIDEVVEMMRTIDKE